MVVGAVASILIYCHPALEFKVIYLWWEIILFITNNCLLFPADDIAAYVSFNTLETKLTP